MTNKLLFLTGVLLMSVAALTQSSTSTASSSPEYAADGKLKLPEQYREWVYLSTGMDMSYTAGGNMDHHMFDNVFVNPESYKKFKDTGTWPDKTMLVLEVRGAESRASINQRGNFQSGEVMGIEVHVKDESRFPAASGPSLASTTENLATHSLPVRPAIPVTRRMGRSIPRLCSFTQPSCQLRRQRTL